ncbi:MAG: addiction module antitoxin RelB [Balneolaceae bacterium]|nr:MAG: addiction module antitoxin RelB [Balneolaceae bacterium]
MNGTFPMITDLKENENSALNLKKKNKACLADKLLQSIHGKIDPEIEQAWIDEVQKRKGALKSGDASLHSASDVLSEARKRLQK